MLQGIWVTGERWLEPCGEWKGEMVVWREPGYAGNTGEKQSPSYLRWVLKVKTYTVFDIWRG